MQLFRVELVDDSPGHVRISLNDRKVGPAIPDAHGGAVFRWFMGYLEQNVADTAARFGIDTSAVVSQEHTVPAQGPCPSCGKGPNGPIVGITEHPCPECRR